MREFLLDDDFELRSEYEDRGIFENLPVPLLMENIIGQINDPLSSNVDNLSPFMNQLKGVFEEYHEDGEIRPYLLEFTSDLIADLNTELSNGLDLGIDIREGEIEDSLSIIYAIYDSLILKYRRNLTVFFYKYIQENADTIITEYATRDYSKSKDITSTTMRTYNITDQSILSIICNIPLIIKDICSNFTIEPEEFLEYSGVIKFESGSRVYEWFKSGRICGTFVNAYFEKLLDEYEDVRNEIVSDIKMRLIKINTQV